MDTALNRSSYDKVILIVTLIALIVTFIPLFFYNQLGEGEIIPIHYNLAGEIDGWGSRSFLFIIPLIAFIIFVFLFFFENNYRKFNYPLKINQQNAEPVYRLGVSLMRHLNLFCILTLAYLNNASLAIAMGYGSGLNKYIMMGFVVLIIGSAMNFYIKMLQYKD